MIPSGPTALTVAAACFLASLAFALLARRATVVPAVRSLIADVAAPPAPAPARHPVLAAADWLRDERDRRAADRFVDRAVEEGVPEALDRLREAFVPKARPGSAPGPA